LLVGDHAGQLLSALAGHHPGYMPKWIDRQQT
jgi:hypothetical protein